MLHFMTTDFLSNGYRFQNTSSLESLYAITSGAEDFDDEESDDDQDPDDEDDGLTKVESDSDDAVVEDFDIVGVLSDEETSKNYARHNKYVENLITMYLSLWRAADYVYDDPDIDFFSDDKLIRSFVAKLKETIDFVYNFDDVDKSGKKFSVTNRLFGDDQSLYQKFKLPTRSGYAQPTSYRQVLQYVEASLGRESPSDNAMFKKFVDALFNDLSSKLNSDLTLNRFKHLIGKDPTMSLRRISQFYSANILDANLDPPKYRKLEANIEAIAEKVNANTILSYFVPPTIEDNNGNTLTQEQVRHSIANAFKNFFSTSRPYYGQLENSGLLDDLNQNHYSKVINNKVKFYSEEFSHVNEVFDRASKYMLEYYRNRADDPNSTNADEERYTKFKSSVDSVKQKMKLINEIYRTELKRLLRLNNRQALPYSVVYNKLNQLGVDEIYGPKPYSDKGYPVTMDQSKRRKKWTTSTGFKGLIDDRGRFYTNIETDAGGNKYGGVLINSPGISPNTPVVMNPKYDYVNDNGYPFLLLQPKVDKRIYTHSHHKQAAENRYANINKDYFSLMHLNDNGTVNISPPPFRNGERGWLSHMVAFVSGRKSNSLATVCGDTPSYDHLRKYTKDSGGWKSLLQNMVHATICELVFQTCIRVSHKDASTENKKSGSREQTYGASTLLRKHIEFSWKNLGDKYVITGAKLEYIGKKGVPDQKKVGNFTTENDNVSMDQKNKDTNIEDIAIGRGSSNEDRETALFLYALYVCWGYHYDFSKKDFVRRTNAGEKVFVFTWHGKGTGRSQQAFPDDNSLRRYMKVGPTSLGMNTGIHDIRKFNGTLTAMRLLFEEKQIGGVKNPFLDKQYFEYDTNDQGVKKERTPDKKVQVASLFCKAVATVVGHQLGHYTNTGAGFQQQNVSYSTAVDAYIFPIVFIKYLQSLNINTPPQWIKRSLDKLHKERSTAD